VVNMAGRTSRLTIGHFQDVVTIPPQSPSSPVRLPVSSAPQGSTQISLSLTSANGTALPVTKSLTVLSTRYGRAILFLIGAAIAVFVLTSLYRAVRRRLHDDTNLVSEEAGPPGSVVTGTSDARHPTEAPDDLADARRWVDDA
jgi:beta-lactamase regulating signal transducer with metallopeptidase domain